MRFCRLQRIGASWSNKIFAKLQPNSVLLEAVAELNGVAPSVSCMCPNLSSFERRFGLKELFKEDLK